MGGLEESTGEGAAKVGGNASLTGASNYMSSRKEHLMCIYVYMYVYIYVYVCVYLYIYILSNVINAYSKSEYCIYLLDLCPQRDPLLKILPQFPPEVLLFCVLYCLYLLSTVH